MQTSGCSGSYEASKLAEECSGHLRSRRRKDMQQGDSFEIAPCQEDGIHTYRILCSPKTFSATCAIRQSGRLWMEVGVFAAYDTSVSALQVGSGRDMAASIWAHRLTAPQVLALQYTCSDATGCSRHRTFRFRLQHRRASVVSWQNAAFLKAGTAHRYALLHLVFSGVLHEDVHVQLQARAACLVSVIMQVANCRLLTSHANRPGTDCHRKPSILLCR